MAVTLPSTVTNIGVGTFQGCSSIAKITLPSKVTTLERGTFCDCSLLASIYFETDPETISISAFDECHKLTTMKAPSFSTTTFNTNPQEALVRAGFSLRNLKDTLFDKSTPLSHDGKIDIYYNMKIWAKTRCIGGRLPLCAAAVKCLNWTYIRQVFTVNMPAIHEVDVITGLPLFMLTAIGANGNLESTYNLLKNYPAAIMLIYNR